MVERKSDGSSFITIAKLGEDSTSYKDSGLSVNTQYTYRVKVLTSSGSGLYSGEASATTYLTRINNPVLPIPQNLPSLVKPAAPAKLRAVLAGTEIQISWLDQSNNENGFKLERKTENTEYTQIAVLSMDTTTYKDIDIALSEREKTYNYRVCAFNNSGTSSYSNEVSVRVPPSIIVTTYSTKIIKYRIGQTSYTINGQVHTMDVPPLVIHNRTYLPIRPVAESLGAVVSWDGDLQKVTIILNGITVEMVINSSMAQVNGADTPIADDPQITPLLLSNRVYVPVAFVASSLGFDVAWDAALQEITLTYPKQ
ncbi:MAG TPA: stalk domain-containing protein [Syntrophomonadaceae bacterium]|nr:stalk domain-containing protein [Syntrophomonadaceae bacterium]